MLFAVLDDEDNSITANAIVTVNVTLNRESMLDKYGSGTIHVYDPTEGTYDCLSSPYYISGPAVSLTRTNKLIKSMKKGWLTKLNYVSAKIETTLKRSLSLSINCIYIYCAYQKPGLQMLWHILCKLYIDDIM